MTYVITRSCCNDASCVDVCPVDCIHPTPGEASFATAEMLYIHPDECIDCGACVSECPVDAIYPDHELPDKLADYLSLNRAYFEWTGPPPALIPAAGPEARVDHDAPISVAVVGSGPSGWYVAEALVESRRADVHVTVIDRLLTPHGLVRYGVAPDHLDTKRVAAAFERIAAHRDVTLRLGVAIGSDLSHEELTSRHHAVVYATGAPEGRSLGIPGEERTWSAAEFVGWYSGHPDHLAHPIPLDHPRAIVIGNGNVGLDMARMLLASPDQLRASDVAPHALEALTKSSVEEVVVVARRSAEFAAFTTPELMAIIADDDIQVVVDGADLEGLGEPTSFGDAKKRESLSRIAASTGDRAKRLVLRFGLTPVEVQADGVSFHTGETIEAGIVLRATGYTTASIEGMSHEDGHLSNERGRVTPGVYAAGWAKRGPTGGIGSSRIDAAETVSALLDDFAAGALKEPVGDLDWLLQERGLPLFDHDAWRRLDAYEVAAGQATGRPRSKVLGQDEQLRIGVGT